MTDFSLNETERMLQRVTHDFARNEIRPVTSQFDEREEFPWDIARQGAAIGLSGVAWAGPGA